MIPAYTLVYPSQHVLGVLSRDAFKEGCEKSSLVEASFVIGEPGRPRPYFGCFFRVVWLASVYYIIPNGVHPARYGLYRGDHHAIGIDRGFRQVFNMRRPAEVFLRGYG